MAAAQNEDFVHLWIQTQSVLQCTGIDDFPNGEAHQEVLDMKNWIEAAEQEVSLLCDLAPTIQLISDDANDPLTPRASTAPQDVNAIPLFSKPEGAGSGVNAKTSTYNDDGKPIMSIPLS
ncbi:hypothetical protein PV08_01153 [Exophiala spinifera]|uniref:Uncharacterized protein n=1 Tax=Exophiala spinifera TaxID=91928 RepID=A0A0D2BNV1_9EURO|nr:uncharacterized protein PV08_01153 [Exophiala spinifera]KIW20578.1 hypothetical protein PV08_01153 [Exophiala spinifera]